MPNPAIARAEAADTSQRALRVLLRVITNRTVSTKTLATRRTGPFTVADVKVNVEYWSA
jgi:hypothetical protein